MGYVFLLEDAKRCDEWRQSKQGQIALGIQKDLLLRIWAPLSPQRVLEVGCGNGFFLDWLDSQGHQATGIDSSADMLEMARSRLPRRIELDCGSPEHLPYEDNTFDTVAMITSIEFSEDPLQALREACRVARRHVLLGVLNRYSLVTWLRFLDGFWNLGVGRRPRFYSVFGLHRLVNEALSGAVPLHWRTCLSLPLSALRRLGFLERTRCIQWHPFGHFIAMRVDITYPVSTIQQPLFVDIPSGLAQAPFRPSCWRTRHEEKSCEEPVSRQAHGRCRRELIQAKPDSEAMNRLFRGAPHSESAMGSET